MGITLTNKLQEATISFIVDRLLTLEQQIMLQSTFISLDKDINGHISPKDFDLSFKLFYKSQFK